MFVSGRVLNFGDPQDGQPNSSVPKTLVVYPKTPKIAVDDSEIQKKFTSGGTGTPLKINVEHVLMEVWKMIFLHKLVICRFHVNLLGCSLSHYLQGS